MTLERKRTSLWVAGLVLLFGTVAWLLLHLFPAPHKRLHYLIAGTCATFVLLVVIASRLRARFTRPLDPIPDGRTPPENAPPS